VVVKSSLVPTCRALIFLRFSPRPNIRYCGISGFRFQNSTVLDSAFGSIVIPFRERKEAAIRPSKGESGSSDDLFRSRLDQIIKMRHELVRLANEIDREWIDTELADLFYEAGRSALPTRYMVGQPTSNTSTDCRTNACASAGSTIRIPALHRRDILPARHWAPRRTVILGPRGTV
jgi:hypothetical protein